MIPSDCKSPCAIFVCGMSRGGTTWIGKMLNEHPHVAVWGESLYWGRRFIAPKSQDKYSIDELDQVLRYLRGGTYAFLGKEAGCLKKIDKQAWIEILNSISKKTYSPAELFLEVNNRICEIEGKSVVVEKTPHHIDFTERIKEYLPDAKFIVCYRDPFSFCLSYKHQGDRKEITAKKKFRRLYHPLGAMLIWRRYNKSIQRTLRLFESHSIQIKFDDLRSSPQSTLERVFHFLDVEPYNVDFNSVEKNSSFLKERKTLEKQDLFWIYMLLPSCSQGQKWIKLRKCICFKLLLSFLALPVWSLFVLWYFMRSVSPGSKVDYFKRIFRR